MNRIGTFFLGFLVGGVVVYTSLHYHIVRKRGRLFRTQGGLDLLGNVCRRAQLWISGMERTSGAGRRFDSSGQDRHFAGRDYSTRTGGRWWPGAAVRPIMSMSFASDCRTIVPNCSFDGYAAMRV